MENLINKILKEGEEKSRKIIQEAKKAVSVEFEKQKEIIDAHYREKEKKLKEDIDREITNEIINFKLQKEQEILKKKNQIIEECEEKIKEKFNSFLNQNMEEIIKNILAKIDDRKNIEIVIPENRDLKLDEFSIKKDRQLQNEFIIKGKNWDIEFSWETFKKVIEKGLKNLIYKELFDEKESHS